MLWATVGTALTAAHVVLGGARNICHFPDPSTSVQGGQNRRQPLQFKPGLWGGPCEAYSRHPPVVLEYNWWVPRVCFTWPSPEPRLKLEGLTPVLPSLHRC